ncbi:MAG: transposase, partial [Candidatus Competibacteraceae bacterium]|nr:transposase [Candidatus Competibacteraceae bacterium]
MIHYVSLQPGARVVHQGTHYAVVQALDLETVLVKEVETGASHRLAIRELEPPPVEGGNEAPVLIELAAVSDEDWKIAQHRFDAIQPVLDSYSRTREDVRERAREFGVNAATIYRWINDFGRTGKLSALLPSQRSAARGRSRLDPRVETILVSVIEEYYLTNQKATIAKTAREVNTRCKRAQLEPPHPGTVRNRILKLSDQQRLKSRYGSRAVRDRFDPAPDKFPGADYPLAVVQIDHTKANVIVVDDDERLPIGRAWLTVAIDVYSRVIVGYYLSLDPPSAMSVGLCLAHAIFPKDSWLAARGIEATWPVWGIMDAVHADNAKEFRGEMLSLAASELNFRLEWRPVKNPKYGGHIEALCGTLKRGLDELPGTTFSGPSERTGYDSEKEAAMTFSELELWLAKYITEVYHP